MGLLDAPPLAATRYPAISSGTNLNDLLLASTDVSGYRSWSFQYAPSSFTGVVRVQFSNDNATWLSTVWQDPTSNTSGILQLSFSATAQLARGEVAGRYMRIIVTTGGTGTASGSLVLSSAAPAGAVLPTPFNVATIADALASSGNNPYVAALGLVHNGATWDQLRGAKIFKTLNAVAIGTEATIWTPAGGKKFRLMGFCLSAGTAAGNVLLKDNTGGTTILVLPKAPLDTPFSSPPMGNGILSAAANNVLTATGVATETLSGYVFGTEE